MKELILLKVTTVKKNMICHYLSFNNRFKFYYSVYNDYRDLSIMCLNRSNDDNDDELFQWYG